MRSLLGRRSGTDAKARRAADTAAAGAGPGGWRFTLKGSPRHYDDVLQIIEAGGGTVYFGEALTYERGAGVALWRVQARSFEWLPRLYEWWAEAERIEPIISDFHLYLPSNLKYAALTLRQTPPSEVEAFIRANAPTDPIPVG
ncbi:MAG: hypothetical protein WKF80_11390 [Thermomicrobiales bacterium]